MNKPDFLNNLKNALTGLPHDDIQKTIDYYSEIIDDAVEDGNNEQEAIARLGNIEDIAEKVIDETPLSRFVREDVKNRNMSTAVIILLIVGSPLWLVLFVTIFAVGFSLYTAIWSVILSFFATFAALVISGAAMLIISPFLLPVRPLKAMFTSGTALICAGLSVFLFYISVWSAKAVIKFTVFLVRKAKERFIKKGCEIK